MSNTKNVSFGAGCIAGAILESRHNLTFFDTFCHSIDQVAAEVIEKDFDVLMISSVTQLFPDARQLIQLVKQRKQLPVLVGGIHATVIGERLLDEAPEVDYLCLGEGESMVKEFLNHLGTSTLLSVENLAYRKNGRSTSNPVRPAEDLKTLPPFPWQLFHQNGLVTDELGTTYVSSSRGCPYNYSYCSNFVYLNQYGKQYLRTRPIAQIIDELAELKERYNSKFFYFSDEMFLTNEEHALSVLKEVKRKINIPVGFMARIEHITPKVVDVLRENGCEYVGMGIECGNEEFRKKHLNRHMSNREIERAFRLIKDAGIFVRSYNMIGFPFENDDELTASTVELNKRIEPNHAMISIFYPFPGTKFYQLCIEKDLIDFDKLPISVNKGDSVLRGVSLREKIIEIDRIVNPLSINDAIIKYREKKWNCCG